MSNTAFVINLPNDFIRLILISFPIFQMPFHRLYMIVSTFIIHHLRSREGLIVKLQHYIVRHMSVGCYSVQLLITLFVKWLNTSRHFKLARTAINIQHTMLTTAMNRHVQRRNQKPIRGSRSTLNVQP